MLKAFHGKCKFRQYLPKKSARYGINMFELYDSKTYCSANLEIYPGKQSPGPYWLQRCSSIGNSDFRYRALRFNKKLVWTHTFI